jgi:hypothetical protein
MIGRPLRHGAPFTIPFKMPVATDVVCLGFAICPTTIARHIPYGVIPAL